MNYWKIKNVSKGEVKFVCKTASNSSKGIILKEGEFCIAEPFKTAHIDIQTRKGFLKIEDFDNSNMRLELATPYSESKLKSFQKKSKLEIAEKNATEYIVQK